MIFASFESMGRVALSAICAYIALIIILRISGKRSLAKLNVFDWAVTVAFGSSLATVMLSQDVPLADGVLAFAMLAGLQFLVSQGSVWSDRFKVLVRSEPMLLVKDGRYLRDAMKQERVTQSELDATIRSEGIGRLSDVAAVVLETDGSFSVIKKGGEGELTALRSIDRPS